MKNNSRFSQSITLPHLFLLVTLALGLSSIFRLIKSPSLGGLLTLATLAVPILLYYDEKKDVRTAIAAILIAVGAYGVIVFLPAALRGSVESAFAYVPLLAARLVMLSCGLYLLVGNASLKIVHRVFFIAGLVAAFIFLAAGLIVGFQPISSFISILCTILGYGLLPDKEYSTPKKATIKSFTALITVLVFILISFSGIFSSVGGTGGGSGNSRTCKSCGRTFTDSANIRSIAKTGMCSNCYSNFKWGMAATGKGTGYYVETEEEGDYLVFCFHSETEEDDDCAEHFMLHAG